MEILSGLGWKGKKVKFSCLEKVKFSCSGKGKKVKFSYIYKNIKTGF